MNIIIALLSSSPSHHPFLQVIQIQIPSEPPASFFTSSEDGPGWAIMMYYMITEVGVYT
jgi:hypothetical protein